MGTYYLDRRLWVNDYETVVKANISEREYQARLAKQRELTGHSSKGSLGMFSKIGLGGKKAMLKMGIAVTNTEEPGKIQSHLGVGAAGYLTVEKEKNMHFDIPVNDLFKGGRTFQIRGRFFNYPCSDDAATSYRCLALKFADKNHATPNIMDLLFITGTRSPFPTLAAMESFMQGWKKGPAGLKEHLLSMPLYMESFLEGVRRGPESYYHQVYTCPSVHVLKSAGTEYMVRFRVVPADGSYEVGLLDNDTQKKVWEMKRDPDDERAKDYLKTDMNERLETGPVVFLLQIQIREYNRSSDSQLSNACLAWDEHEFPYYDLAYINFTTPLPAEVLSNTKFNLRHLVPQLSLPQPHSTADYAVVSEFMNECDVFGVNSHIGLVKSKKKVKKGDTVGEDQEEAEETYQLHIETGKWSDAGTDADIMITLIGTAGRTSRHHLDHAGYDDFETGIVDTYEINDVDIGEILTVQIDMETKSVSEDWYLKSVSVEHVQSGQHVHMACQRWMTKRVPTVILCNGAAGLRYREQTKHMRLHRRYEVEEQKRRYRWYYDEGLPGYIDSGPAHRIETIPRDVQFDEDKAQSFWNNIFNSRVNLGLGSMAASMEPWDEFSDYKKFITKSLPQSKVRDWIVDHWRDDIEFGRQMLNGVAPNLIEKITELPENFPVTDEDVKGLLEREMDLKQELEAGNMFLIDLADLKGIRPYGSAEERRFICHPFCLLYVRKDGFLVPIAIKLVQDMDTDRSMIWTPNDTPLDWIYIKIWFRAALSQYHHLYTHLLMTHLIVEAFAVAAHRGLPSIHPVTQLLQPHLRYTLAINVFAKHIWWPGDNIIDKTCSIGGSQLQFVAKMYSKIWFNYLNLPKDLKRRGCDDPKTLPNYYYRDDGLLLWKVIEDYVREVCEAFYMSDYDVHRDEELQNTITDFRENGMKGWDENADHGVPQELTTIDGLVDFLTTIIFTASGQHAAVNSGKLDTYAFVPNSPMCMTLPPPSKRDMKLRTVMRGLPSKQAGSYQVLFAAALSRPPDKEESLVDFPLDHMISQPIRTAAERFQADLLKLAAKLEERNAGMDCPYPYLVPTGVPSSIGI